MTIKTLAELQEPDERTLHFSPLGLGGRMRPEDAVDFQQHVVARHNLVAAVAEGTRQSFEQLRTIFGYGLLCYDIYTLVNDHTLLVFEQALRDRFIDFHQGTVTFVSPKDGQHEDVAAEKYEQVRQFVSRHRGWRLRVGSETISFNAMLGGLLGWARAAGLFRGQRNRGVEQAIARLRNLVAHPDSYHLTTPVDAADTIGDLAEIINHIWGWWRPNPGVNEKTGVGSLQDGQVIEGKDLRPCHTEYRLPSASAATSMGCLLRASSFQRSWRRLPVSARSC